MAGRFRRQDSSSGEHHSNGLETNGNGGKKVSFVITDRGLYEYAVELYSDRKVFIREALQNAIDSGAATFSVTIKPDRVEIADDGKGMSADFLEREFNKLGERFKVGDEIGHYGVGRLSFFGPILSEEGSELKYNGHVEIVAKDGERATRLIWNKISEYELVDEGPTKEKGTTVMIIADNPDSELFKTARDKMEIVNYIGTTLVDNGRIKVVVDGSPMVRDYGIEGTVPSAGTMYNSQLSANVSYTYDISVCSAVPGLIIADHGLRASFLEFPVGGTINFTSGKSRDGNAAGIMSLSRDKLTLIERVLKEKFITEGFMPLYDKKSTSEKEKDLERIVRLFDYFRSEDIDLAVTILKNAIIDGKSVGEWRREKIATAMGKNIWTKIAEQNGYHIIVSENMHLLHALDSAGIPSIYDVREEILDNMMIDGKKLRDWRKEKAVWTTVDDSWTEKAMQKGYHVFVVKEEELISAFERNRIPNLSTIMNELVDTTNIHGGVENSQKAVLKKSADYLRFIDEAVKTLPRAKGGEVFGRISRKGSVDLVDYHEFEYEVDGERFHGDEVIKLGEGVKVAGMELFFAEHNNEDICAFWYDGKMCLNLNNEFVQEVIEKGRPDLLMPTLVHEYTHKLGYTLHDNEFVSADSTILKHVLLEIARNEERATQKGIRNAFSGIRRLVGK